MTPTSQCIIKIIYDRGNSWGVCWDISYITMEFQQHLKYRRDLNETTETFGYRNVELKGWQDQPMWMAHP